MPPSPERQQPPLAHIVATGLRCAVGLDTASAAAAIRARVSPLAEHPLLTDGDGERVICAREPTLDPQLTGAQRLVELAGNCLREVTEQLTAAAALPERLHLLLALPELRPGFETEDAQHVQSALGSAATTDVPTAVSLIGEGHAGALLALRTAVESVVSGRFELLIVGGVDSYLDAATITWLDRERRLAREDIRSGFPPGEGAAMLAIASEAARARLGLGSLAEIRRVACSHESRDPGGEVGLLGEALTQAVMEVTAGLEFPRDAISDIYGDVNGETARTHDWGFTLLRTAHRFRDGTDCISTVGQCGDMGAATGVFGCVLAAEAWRMERARGPRALVWAASWGGLRGAALVDAADA